MAGRAGATSPRQAGKACPSTSAFLRARDLGEPGHAAALAALRAHWGRLDVVELVPDVHYQGID